MSFCPAHSDGSKSKRRSLGLSPTGVLQCFAGCSFKEIIHELNIAPLNNTATIDRPRTSSTTQQSGNALPSRLEGFAMVEEYEYKDGGGNVIGIKGRFEKDGEKSFAWRKPKSPNWHGLGTGFDMNLVPFWGIEDLPKWGMDEWIVICEGERATIACRAMGLHAVTHGGGSGIHNFDLTIQPFAGRKIALWPDNDEVGRKYMKGLYQALAPIVSEIKFLMAPVPYKGDAFDYFTAGGTVDDLWKQEFSAPLVTIIGPDNVEVTVPVDIGPVRFSFTGMVYEKRHDLMCYVEVEALTPGLAAAPFGVRLNLESLSGREGFIRSLAKHYPTGTWPVCVSVACSKAKEAFVNQQRGISMRSIVEATQEHFLIDGLIPENNSTVIFGDGEGGKTTITYDMGVAIATGSDFHGRAVKKRNVMIVDYESKESGARLRLGRITRGAGLTDVPENIYYWWAQGIPLAEQTESLTKFIRDEDIGCVIIDSGAPACGGQPEDASTTVAFFNGVNRLGPDVTTIIIAHQSKADAYGNNKSMTPFGSIFWKNLPRKTYLVESTKGETTNDIALVPAKTNNDGRRKPIGFQYDYQGDEGIGPIVITAKDITQMNGMTHLLPAADRIKAVLTAKAQPMAIHEIMAELNMQGEDNLKRISGLLAWGRENNRFTQEISPDGRYLWKI